MTLHFENFGCHLGGNAVLQEISLTLAAGCTAVIGANGAGKSTLLQACADGGRFFPHARLQGRVMLDDNAVQDVPLDALARRRAFLPQQHVHPLQASVRELLCLATFAHGSAHATERLYAEALAIWELTALAGRSCSELSGGERQRAHLARTWLQVRLQEEPGQRLWLLDEPQNGLDLPHQQRLRHCLRAEGDSGATVLFSTHDINFALRTATRIVVLKAGRVLAAGSADEIADPALLQQAFGIGFDRLAHPVDGRPWLLPH
jgi:iron complex transport system ATP-binding protein